MLSGPPCGTVFPGAKLMAAAEVVVLTTLAALAHAYRLAFVLMLCTLHTHLSIRVVVLPIFAM